MNPSFKSPSYLVRTPFAYCFRMAVPRDIQPLVGKTELRYSLKTGSLSAAKQKARLLAGHVQLYFQRVRQQGVIMGSLTQDQIESLVSDYIRSSVKAWDIPLRPEDFDFERNDPPPYQTAEEIQEYIHTLDAVREDLVVEMNLGQCRMLEKIVLSLLKRNGIDDVLPGSPEFQRLCYLIIKAEIHLLPLQQRHLQGDLSYGEELPKIFVKVFPFKEQPLIKPPALAQPQVTLAEVAEKYWREGEPRWSPRTRTEYRTYNRQLLEFFDQGRPIATIDYSKAQEYKEFLQNKTIRKNSGLSTIRINLYLNFAKAVFHFAQRNHFVEINPFPGLNIPEKGRRADEMRDVFDSKDLEKLFVYSKEYGKDAHIHAHYFWIPLLGLYTGCRLEEICQLYIADIKQEQGIWVLDINQDKPDKSIKTHERRLVPLHPFLVEDLKLVDFVKSLPHPEGRVFPKLKRINDRYSHGISQWFGRFRKRCGIIAENRKKDFHSFRHTVANHLKQRDVPEAYIAQLLGHKIESITLDRYGKRYEIKPLLNETVLNLNYGIDLMHLKSSKYVQPKSQ